MKIIVTHTAPDWDAITSVWLLKRYFGGWEDASIQFVPAGTNLEGTNPMILETPVEHVRSDEVIHVDTGLGPLDHHQTNEQTVSAASRTMEYVLSTMPEDGNAMHPEKLEALKRLVSLVVATDHFQEVFWADAAADYHEFSLLGLLEGLKMLKPDHDTYYVDFGMECLDALFHTFENRIWAEKEIAKGKKFQTKWGEGIAFETLNDTVLKLAQKMGYILVVRKDPRKGYVRIKVKPNELSPTTDMTITSKGEDIDLTPVYEELRKKDPMATWFLHVSKKMLLNGTPKNPKMMPTSLSLDAIVDVLENI